MSNLFTSESVQRYLRIALYHFWAILGSWGYTAGDSTKTLVASILGSLLTVAWSIWGHRLSALFSEAEKVDGVEKIKVEADPTKVDLPALAAATPNTVTIARAA